MAWQDRQGRAPAGQDRVGTWTGKLQDRGRAGLRAGVVQGQDRSGQVRARAGHGWCRAGLIYGRCSTGAWLGRAGQVRADSDREGQGQGRAVQSRAGQGRAG